MCLKNIYSDTKEKQNILIYNDIFCFFVYKGELNGKIIRKL